MSCSPLLISDNIILFIFSLHVYKQIKNNFIFVETCFQITFTKRSNNVLLLSFSEMHTLNKFRFHLFIFISLVRHLKKPKQNKNRKSKWWNIVTTCSLVNYLYLIAIAYFKNCITRNCYLWPPPFFFVTINTWYAISPNDPTMIHRDYLIIKLEYYLW